MTTDITLSALDEKMLGMADHRSPEEISQKLGGVISPVRVRVRLNELLQRSNWITEAQREQLIIHRLHGVLRQIENRPGAEWDLDGLKVQLSTLKELGNRLDKRAARTDIDVNRWERNVALEMLRVVDIALGYMKGALRESVDSAEWDRIKREAIEHAEIEVMKQAIEP